LPVRVRRLLYGALWVTLLGGVLTAWPVQFGGPTGYTIVSGHSMEPVYHPGDLLITRSQQHYQPGQIVVYTIPAGAPAAGFHVVHRLIAGSGMPGETGCESPRHVRRLHSLGRMESCREIQRSGTRRS
jgi:signal peptidase